MRQLLSRIGLSCPDPDDERAFFDAFGTQYLAFVRLVLFLGGALLIVFVEWDRIIDPVGAQTTFWIRTLFMAPVVWLCAGILFWRRTHPYIEPITVAAGSLTTMGIAAVCAILDGGYDVVVGGGDGLIILFVVALLPMRTPAYLIFCAATLASYFVGQAFTTYSPGMPLVNLLMIGTSLFLGGVSVVSREWNARAQFKAQREIAQSNKRIEELLHSMLPSDIVRRMQAGETQIADLHREVSIVFSDLVGFTELSRSMSATQLVDVLNRLFSEFDYAADAYGMHKIKTIGDAYMAVGGVVSAAAPVDAACRAAEFAFAMQRATRKLSAEIGVPLDVRVGLHVGPVVAGVIGTSRPAFDCWGESVNLASRLESSAGPGAVQISESAFRLLRDNYDTEVREGVTLKGIGMTKVYLLLPERRDRPTGFRKRAKGLVR